MKPSRLGLLTASAVASLMFSTLGAAEPTFASTDHKSEAADPSADFSIVNGQVTSYDQIPAYIQIAIKDKHGKFLHNCGGTLLDSQWVLSAAHCFWNSDHYERTGQLVPLPLGSYYAIHNPKHEEHLVDEVVFPGELNQMGWPADIALIRVNKPFTTDARMTIPAPNLPRPTGGIGTVWGKGNSVRIAPNRYDVDSHDIYEAKLRRADVTINRPEFCGDPKKTPHMLCAETPSKTGNAPASCTGDSGGPLTIYSNDPKTQLQIGLVSHADAPDGVEICGGQPTWYTDLSYWSGWIKSKVPNVRTTSYRLNPVDNAPWPVPPTTSLPAPADLQCGSVETPGSTQPDRDTPSLTYSPARGAQSGSQVSIAASQLTWPAGTKPAPVILAGECAWADALAATALTSDAPLLLNRPDSLEPEVASEISRLGVKSVMVIGGPKAVSEQVVKQLTDKGLDVRRVEGASRVGTAASVATLMLSGGYADSVLVARAYPAPGGSPSQAFADSLAGAYYAPWKTTPIVLSASNELSSETKALLRSSQPKKATLLGGIGALSNSVEQQIKTQITNTSRLAGKSRAETAATIGRSLLNDTADRARGVMVIEGQADDAWKTGFTFAGLAKKTQSVYALASGNDLAPESIALIKEAKQKGLPIRCVASQKACEKARGL